MIFEWNSDMRPDHRDAPMHKRKKRKLIIDQRAIDDKLNEVYIPPKYTRYYYRTYSERDLDKELDCGCFLTITASVIFGLYSMFGGIFQGANYVEKEVPQYIERQEGYERDRVNKYLSSLPKHQREKEKKVLKKQYENR